MENQFVPFLQQGEFPLKLGTAMQLNKLLIEKGMMVIEKDSAYMKELAKKTQKMKKRVWE